MEFVTDTDMREVVSQRAATSRELYLAVANLRHHLHLRHLRMKGLLVARLAEPLVEQQAVQLAEPLVEQQAVQQAEPLVEQQAVQQAEPLVEQQAVQLAEPLVARLVEE